MTKIQDQAAGPALILKFEVKSLGFMIYFFVNKIP